MQRKERICKRQIGFWMWSWMDTRLIQGNTAVQAFPLAYEKGSGSGTGGSSGRRILLEREAQDPFSFRRVRRAGNIIERTCAKRLHVCVPIGQARKNNNRGAARGGSQHAQGSAEIAIRQIVTAQHKLKRLFSYAGSRVRQGSATNEFQTEAGKDFFCLATRNSIGGYNQHLAGVGHFMPPGKKFPETKA